jgi:integrase
MRSGVKENTGIRVFQYPFSGGKFHTQSHYTDWANKFLTETETEYVQPMDVVGRCELYTRGMHTGEIKSNRGTKYSPPSVSTYTNAASNLYKYSLRAGTIHLERFSGLQGVEERKKARDKWNRFWIGFDRWMEDRSMKAKSRHEIINAIKIMVTYWAREEFLTLPEFPKIGTSVKPIVVIPPKLIPAIINDVQDDVMWEVVATILVSTLRIGDVLTLSPSDFEFDGEEMYFNKTLSKTGSCTMPVPPVLAKVYRKNFPSVFSKPIEKQDVYDGIKQFLSKYPELQVEHTVTTDGVQETRKLYEWATPHMLRKSAITAMIYFGVDHMHVRHASGHSHGSKAFWRYVQVVDSKFKSEISKAHLAMGISS